MKEDIVSNIKKISITSYLENQGYKSSKEKNTNSKTWFSSPFGSDSSPSFCVYEDSNTFYDWSSGIGGDIINLVMSMFKSTFNDSIEIISKGSFLPIVNYSKKKKVINNNKFKDFNYKKYLTRDKSCIDRVNRYANSRKISSNYLCGGLYDKDIYNESMVFVYRDEDLDICGVRFRYIDPVGKNRFNSRGRLCFFIIENIIDKDTTLYLTESETSSISLSYILKKLNKSFIILCVGGVTNFPKKIPNSFDSLPIKVIIDYDGDEEKYNKRISNYNKFGEDIKIPLGKGEDINSLWVSGNYKNIIKYFK